MGLLELLGRKEVWITGKGGIGKTTTTAALGLHYATNDEWVLAFDVDGFHSLPDALGIKHSVAHRFRVPENERVLLNRDLGVDLDLCLVSPHLIVDKVRSNREHHKANRTYGLPPYFGILHLYDVLEQLGILVASEDLAALSLITAQRYMYLRTEKDNAGTDDAQKVRILYDNQASNATISLLRRATESIERLRVMLINRFKWRAGATLAGWPDIAAFASDKYVEHIQTYIESFVDFRNALYDETISAYLVVSGGRSTEVSETIRLVEELKAGKYPVAAVLVNQYEPRLNQNIDRIVNSDQSVPVFTAPYLPSFETNLDVKQNLALYIDKIQPYNP